jgi:hypothetical protein
MEVRLPNGQKAEVPVRNPGCFNVFLSSPIYKWPGHPQFHASVDATQKYLQAMGHNVIVHYVCGDALIERARSVLLGAYLAFPEGTFDCMIQMDSDISWHPTAMEAMIRHVCERGLEAVGGPYAFKCDPPHPRAGGTVCRPWHHTDDLAFTPELPQNIQAVRYLGGGSTLVSDALIRRLIKAFPELRMNCNPEDDGWSLRTWDGWQSILIPQPEWGTDEDGPFMELLSEDYAFCERIVTVHERDGGPRVSCYVDLRVHHSHWVGEKAYDVEHMQEIVGRLKEEDSLLGGIEIVEK